jgi:hypothetical protein
MPISGEEQSARHTAPPFELFITYSTCQNFSTKFLTGWYIFPLTAVFTYLISLHFSVQ